VTPSFFELDARGQVSAMRRSRDEGAAKRRIVRFLLESVVESSAVAESDVCTIKKKMGKDLLTSAIKCHTSSTEESSVESVCEKSKFSIAFREEGKRAYGICCVRRIIGLEEET
jgi:hypothetical protein